VLSAFMNNVGALALLMPVAIQMARKLELPPGRVLMPLAFGSILGGMTTLIGTPPNLIVSGFRAETGAGTFAMFDFTPVGLPVAAVGVAVRRAGRLAAGAGAQAGGHRGLRDRRLPDRGPGGEDSKAAGMTLRQIERAGDADAQVVGLVRNEVRVTAPSPGRVPLRAGDILVIEAEAESLPACCRASA
jgi:hypothetical protein